MSIKDQYLSNSRYITGQSSKKRMYDSFVTHLYALMNMNYLFMNYMHDSYLIKYYLCILVLIIFLTFSTH